jgi:hypothetical protein
MQRIFLLSLFVLTSALAFAQRPDDRQRPERDPAERAERLTERLTTVLDLTAEQAAEVKTLHLSFAERATALREEQREEQREEREAARESMQALNEERHEEMKSILTEAQFEKLEALEAQRKERRGERRERRPRQ